MLEQCQRDKSKQKDMMIKKCDGRIREMQAVVDAAQTKATIAKRGYALCTGELAAANAQGASMQAEALKSQGQIADIVAKQQEQAKKIKITSDVSDKIQKEERDRYDDKLKKAIKKVSKAKPISPKCQACAKLSAQERVA